MASTEFLGFIEFVWEVYMVETKGLLRFELEEKASHGWERKGDGGGWRRSSNSSLLPALASSRSFLKKKNGSSRAQNI